MSKPAAAFLTAEWLHVLGVTYAVDAALLEPHVPRRTLTTTPHLPPRWGGLTLSDLRLGDETAHISATGGKVAVSGLSAGWTT